MELNKSLSYLETELNRVEKHLYLLRLTSVSVT